MKTAPCWPLVLVLAAQPVFAADAFDRHTAEHLRAAIEEEGARNKLTMQDARKLDAISPQVGGPVVVVRTDKGNWAKALVTWGFFPGPDDDRIPVVLVERFVTYRADRQNITAARGEDVMLFPGFGFDLDIGQVVPESLGGDVGVDSGGALAPKGEARLYGLDGSQLPETETSEADPNDHEGVLARDFAGRWKVDVDGRWQGEWSLRVEKGGQIRGTHLSSESKSTYPITGRIAVPSHRAKLTVHFENAAQSFDAFLWTTDKSTMTGVVTFAGRKFGFRAVRADADGNDSDE